MCFHTIFFHSTRSAWGQGPASFLLASPVPAQDLALEMLNAYYLCGGPCDGGAHSFPYVAPPRILSHLKPQVNMPSESVLGRGEVKGKEDIRAPSVALCLELNVTLWTRTAEHFPRSASAVAFSSLRLLPPPGIAAPHLAICLDLSLKVRVEHCCWCWDSLPH